MHVLKKTKINIKCGNHHQTFTLNAMKENIVSRDILFGGQKFYVVYFTLYTKFVLQLLNQIVVRDLQEDLVCPKIIRQFSSFSFYRRFSAV
jgi:hypothetical protein